MYTKIGWKWIKDVNIVLKDGAGYDNIWVSVAILGSNYIFGTFDVAGENGGSTYVVDILVP